MEQLGLAGVGRAAISVSGVGVERSTRIDALYSSAQDMGDDPALRQASFVSYAARVQGEVAAIAVPLLIGGFGGAWAVAASGGALVAAVGATVLGGAVGAGLGVLLFRAGAGRRAANVGSHLDGDGMVLWVSTPDGPAEERACEVLRRCGGRSVHAHVVEREWGAADTPRHSVQPDPFLEREKPRRQFASPFLNGRRRIVQHRAATLQATPAPGAALFRARCRWRTWSSVMRAS